MILQFQNQTDLQEYLQQVKEQPFANLQNLTVQIGHNEAAIELAVKTFNATVIKPPKYRHHSELL